jgi:ubiquinone/menaquinone biosynthesis C-methylase UbiE
MNGLKPFSSVCEIGAATGQNLLNIEKSRPDVQELIGVDINQYIVERSRRELLVDAKTKLVLQDGVEFLEEQLDNKFDVVFIAGVLLSLSEPEASRIVKQCVRVASKNVVFFERHKFGALTGAMGNYGAHDYWEFLADAGIANEKVSIFQLPPSVASSDITNNAAVIADVS